MKRLEDLAREVERALAIGESRVYFSRVSDVVYPIIAEEVKRHGPIFLSNVTNSIGDFFHDGLNLGHQIMLAIPKYQYEVHVARLGDELRKLYGKYDRASFGKNGSRKKGGLNSDSRILYSTEKQLQDFLREYTSKKTEIVVECSFGKI